MDAIEKVRVFNDAEGRLDTVSATEPKSVALERMDHDAWQLRIEMPDGSWAYVEMTGKAGGHITGLVWREGP